MSQVPSFGERKARKLVRNLGFIVDETKGKGGHTKATHPTRRSKTRQGMITDCIIIPKRKDFSKPLREDWIKELKGFGFTKEEIIKNLQEICYNFNRRALVDYLGNFNSV